MGKQFLAQEINAPVTKKHGVSNRPALPVNHLLKRTKCGD